MRNCALSKAETVLTRERDPVAACTPEAGAQLWPTPGLGSVLIGYAALRRGRKIGDAVPASAGLR
jgi:hypothetical protein